MTDVKDNMNNYDNAAHDNHPSHKMTFDNVYGELDFYKKKCDVMEKDLFKSLTQVKKLELALKKAQELNTLNAKVFLQFLHRT